MNNTQKAIEQAINELETLAVPQYADKPHPVAIAIESLRSALAQQGEPVASVDYGCEPHRINWEVDAKSLPDGTPLYAGAAPAPQAQRPWPMEEQPDGSVIPVDPVEMAQHVKTPGMAVQALAGEIIEALLADEKDDGYDLTAGMFGANFSALVRRWAAAEWSVPHPDTRIVVQQMVDALDDIDSLEGNEKDEWDGVERVIPKMAEIARTAREAGYKLLQALNGNPA